MARQSRIHFKKACYHVQMRAKKGQTLFRSVTDRRSLEALVADGCKRFGHRVLAFAWLSDKIHLVVQVNEIPLSQIMQNLSFRFTRYINKDTERSGPIFEGRYLAAVIEPELYLNELVRYVHNEPVRAGKVKRAGDFKWSSHRAYTGEAPREWLDTDIVLESFKKEADKGTDKRGTSRGKVSLTKFEKYVDDGRSEPERQEFIKGQGGQAILGSDRFIRAALKAKPDSRPNVSLAKLARHVCGEEGIPESRLKSPSRVRDLSEVRQLVAGVAVDLRVATLTDVADRYHRDLTTMSRNQRHFRGRLASDPNLRKRFDRLKRSVKALSAD